MDETRATISLPRIAIEITHRRAPDDSVELIAIALRATPSLGAFADWARRGAWPPLLGLPWLGLGPWWPAIPAVWAPWLALAQAMATPCAIERPKDDAGRLPTA